uniref:Uncharacterized protein n=1 Tax=Plectus sambesii TaxID=2011161 RepID=A0A914VLS6_9BILA
MRCIVSGVDVDKEAKRRADRLQQAVAIAPRLQSPERREFILETKTHLDRLQQNTLPSVEQILAHKMDLFKRLQAFCDYNDSVRARHAKQNRVRISKISKARANNEALRSEM